MVLIVLSTMVVLVPLIRGESIRATNTGIGEMIRFIPWTDVTEVAARPWGIVVRGEGGRSESVYMPALLYHVGPDVLQRLRALHEASRRGARRAGA